jgi:MarR-like DNA-binding transcriptional regulator SgrR of sgrS sRNA
MREITFSEAEVQAIAEERYKHSDPRVQGQMEILWLKYHASKYGFTHEDVAILAGCSRSTVQRTLSKFVEAGLEQVRAVAGKEGHSELDDHSASLEELFKKTPRAASSTRSISSRSTPASAVARPRFAAFCTA